MNSWWNADISSLHSEDIKSKDHMEFEEMLSWLRNFGVCNKDYVIDCIVEVFHSANKHESVSKTKSIINLLTRSENGKNE